MTTLPGLKPLTQDMNLTSIAKKIGIDQSTLNALANCKRGASLAMALDLAKHFNTTVEQLASSPVDSQRN